MRRILSIASAVLVAAAATSGLRAAGEDRPDAAAATQHVSMGQHWFGVSTQNIPPAVAKHLKLKSNQGLMVVQVLPNSPAAQAKLEPDDLLIEVDGKPLQTQEDLARAANAFDAKAGRIKPARITFLRQGDRNLVTLVSVPRPEQFLVQNPGTSFSVAPAGQPVAVKRGGINTLITPGGQTVNLQGGILLSLKGEEASRLRIAELSKENIVLTRETDEQGNTTHKISVGSNVYKVEKDKLNELPANVRNLAEQMLKSDPQKMVQQRGRSTEDRLAEIEEENRQLKARLDALIRLLEKKNPPPTQPAPR